MGSTGKAIAIAAMWVAPAFAAPWIGPLVVLGWLFAVLGTTIVVEL